MVTRPRAKIRELCGERFLRTLRDFVMYGVIGLVGTIFHFLILTGLVELFDVASVTASSAGFIAGAVINHELNRGILFKRTPRSYLASGIRFFSTAVVGFMMNLGIMMLLVSVFAVHYLLAQIFATGIVFLITFVINKRWTFKT